MTAVLQLPDLYAELEALPDQVTGEIVAGELLVSPRPARPHARAATRLVARVGGAFDDPVDDGPGGWTILSEPELHLGDDVLVPDVAGWRSGRLDPDGNEIFFTVAPDWVCEIASPSTAVRDRTVKRDAYARGGVRYLWLVDPDAELVEAFELRDAAWVVLGAWSGDDIARIVPFEAAELKLSHLWGRPVPAAPVNSGESG